MWLTRLAITRPVTILMLVLALVILGLTSRGRLPVDLFPDISFPMLVISTVYPGTGPEEMETLITKPIEDSISSISGLKELSSTSTEGASSILMSFELGTDLNDAAADVRSKLDALRSIMPQDAKAPVVIKADVAAIPVITLSIASDRRSPLEIRRIGDDVLKDRLSQLRGVAAVAVTGGDVREIQLQVDKGRLEAYNLGITQVVAALRAENLNLPSGAVEEGRRNYAVRVLGEFTKPEDILGVRISNAAGDPNLTIAQVAAVKDTVQDPVTYTRVNGKPSVALSVQKQSDANTVKVADGVRKELEGLTGKDFTEKSFLQRLLARGKEKQLAPVPPDIQITVAFDQSTFIKDSLHDVDESLLLGALLAVVIVFLFLHSLRGTFIVALAIPTSMIATFLIMDMVGFSINMMSMLALSLSVGILVDDSIVVIENIHRHLKMGKSPRDAAYAGRTEIGLAAVTITMVDVVVFVPVAFMGGIVGQFFRQFGIVVASATLFSLFVSFTLTPMLASRWLKSAEEEAAEEARAQAHPGLFHRFTAGWEALYGRLADYYSRLLAWTLDHRATVISTGLMIMVASLATTMPKPAPAPLLKGLPILVLILAAIAAGWYGVSWLRGGLRGFLAVLALVVSFVLSGLAPTMAGAPSTMIAMLMVVATLGIVGYMLSLRHGESRQPGASPGPVLRLIAVLGAALVAICLFVPTKLGQEFTPAVDNRQFSISAQLETGAALDTTDVVARQIEDVLFTDYPETRTVFTSVASTTALLFGGGSAETDVAELSVELKPVNRGLGNRLLVALGLRKAPKSTDQVMREINARFVDYPGVKVTASASGHGGGPGGAPIDILVRGDDQRRRLQVAEQIADIVNSIEGTYSTEVSWREGRPEIQAHIDRDRAAQYGMSVAQVASALRTSLAGDTSTRYREGGKEYDIRVLLPKEQRDLLAQLPTMVVGATPAGAPVYLYEVATLEQASGPSKIERHDRLRSVEVTCQLSPGHSLGAVQQKVNERLGELDMSGVTVKWAGQAEMMAESFGDLNNALRLSVALVFILMAALFESLLSPLIIMLAVPQAMAGAFFAMAFTYNSLNIISMIGIIMLVGLVAKNSILLVDYTNTLRREHGLERRQALLRSGPIRMRPILMTTFAMIFGMLPTALAVSRGSEMRQPMAIVVIGGLLLAMFLSLLMVPVFYEIMDSLGDRLLAAKSWLLRRLGV